MSEIDLVKEIASMTRCAAPGQCLLRRKFDDRGTIGVIGKDRVTQKALALTAMHVVPGVTEYPSPLHPGRIEFEAPCFGGTLVGRLLRGTMNGVDAAAIELEGAVPSNSIQGFGQVAFWRSVDPQNDKEKTVRMFGAASGKMAVGRIVRAGVAVPEWNLRSAILVEIPAIRGDSGAPLIDEEDNLIGILVGGNGTRQLFSPIEAVFDALSCDLY